MRLAAGSLALFSNGLDVGGCGKPITVTIRMKQSTSMQKLDRRISRDITFPLSRTQGALVLSKVRRDIGGCLCIFAYLERSAACLAASCTPEVPCCELRNEDSC